VKAQTHRLLVEIPSRIVDAATAAYGLILAALALVSLTTAALWALLPRGYPLWSAYYGQAREDAPRRWRMQRADLVSLVLMFTLSVPAAGQAPENPSRDFGFRFEYGLCTSEVLDTFKGVFTREMKPAPDLSVPLTLEAESLTEIRRAIAEARFFEYPSEFRPGVPNFAPGYRYRLTVQEAGRRHSVFWHDNAKPSTSEADRLRRLFTVMRQMISAHPKVQQLPRANAACG
jgi:hypothetical protein